MPKGLPSHSQGWIHSCGSQRGWGQATPAVCLFFLKSENAKCQRSTWSTGIILSMDDHSSKGYPYIFLFFQLELNWPFPHWGPCPHWKPAPRYNFKHSSHPLQVGQGPVLQPNSLGEDPRLLWEKPEQHRWVQYQTEKVWPMCTSQLSVVPDRLATWVMPYPITTQCGTRQTGHLSNAISSEISYAIPSASPKTWKQTGHQLMLKLLSQSSVVPDRLVPLSRGYMQYPQIFKRHENRLVTSPCQTPITAQCGTRQTGHMSNVIDSAFTHAKSSEEQISWSRTRYLYLTYEYRAPHPKTVCVQTDWPPAQAKSLSQISVVPDRLATWGRSYPQKLYERAPQPKTVCVQTDWPPAQATLLSQLSVVPDRLATWAKPYPKDISYIHRLSKDMKTDWSPAHAKLLSQHSVVSDRLVTWAMPYPQILEIIWESTGESSVNGWQFPSKTSFTGGTLSHRLITTAFNLSITCCSPVRVMVERCTRAQKAKRMRREKWISTAVLGGEQKGGGVHTLWTMCIGKQRWTWWRSCCGVKSYPKKNEMNTVNGHQQMNASRDTSHNQALVMFVPKCMCTPPCAALGTLSHVCD